MSTAISNETAIALAEAPKLAEDVCHVCGKPEGPGPDGLMLRECDKCQQMCCANDSDCDYDMQGDPGQYVLTSWQCKDECLIDIRVPVTVTFDLSILNARPDEVEAMIEKLEDAIVCARLENDIGSNFDEGDVELACGTRYTPAQADMGNVGTRTHARSGSFTPWTRKAGA